MANGLQTNQIKPTDKFNMEFAKFLRQVGWTNTDTVNKFIAKVDSIALTARGLEAQNLILRYLDKGLDLLNMEMQKVELDNQKRISNVNPEEVNDAQSNLKVESVSRRTLKECGCDDNKAGDGENNKAKQIKVLLDQFMEGLSGIQIGNGKSAKDVINITIKGSSGEEMSQKKVLKDTLTEAKEAPKAKQQPKPKKPKEVNLEPKPKKKETPKPAPKPVAKPEPKPKKQEKKKEAPKPEEKPLDGNVQPMINNFQIFLRNFFINEVKATDDVAESVVSSIQKIVERSKDDASKQSGVNASLSDSLSRMKKVASEGGSTETSKNVQVSLKELQKYGTLFMGWSPDQMARFTSRTKDILSLAGNPKFHRAIAGEFQRALKKT